MKSFPFLLKMFFNIPLGNSTVSYQILLFLFRIFIKLVIMHEIGGNPQQQRHESISKLHDVLKTAFHIDKLRYYGILESHTCNRVLYLYIFFPNRNQPLTIFFFKRDPTYCMWSNIYLFTS